MAYHILPLDADYRSRRVPCHETGHFHRHKTHVEQYTEALCGREIIKDSGNYCNLSIARHMSPRCQSCEEVAKKHWPGLIEG